MCPSAAEKHTNRNPVLCSGSYYHLYVFESESFRLDYLSYISTLIFIHCSDNSKK